MSMGELLKIEPVELKFPIELKKQVSCSLRLSNKTDSYVAFKVKTTNPKNYCVRPNVGVVLPRSTCDVIVTMQALKEAPPDLQCRDKFLIQSIKVEDGVTAKSEMFYNEAGHQVEECKLRVACVYPPSSPVDKVFHWMKSLCCPSYRQLPQASKGFVRGFEPQDQTLETSLLIPKLTEEKNIPIQQNNRLHVMWGTSCCRSRTRTDSR